MLKGSIHPLVKEMPMKKTLMIPLILVLLLLCGCAAQPAAQIAATTLPVYEFTARLCQDTPLTVTRLVTEQVSCLHDYTLKVDQVKALQSAQTVVLSGAGLEDFLGDLLTQTDAIDASSAVSLLEVQMQEHDHHEGHVHDHDPHIWLSPANAAAMARTIADGLTARYPAYTDTFQANLDTLLGDLDVLQAYGKETLSNLSCRELVTFHDGFSYFAQCFDLTILEAVEEESGSEASAKELIHLIELVRSHSLPAVFTEKSGSTSAAGIIARETGCQVFTLDMAMAGDSYFDAMYHNIDTIKEALG